MATVTESPQPLEAVSSLRDSQDATSADEKKATVDVNTESSNDIEDGAVDGDDEMIHHPANKDDILTHTLHVQDDPTLNCFTFRTWFLGWSQLSPLSLMALITYTDRPLQTPRYWPCHFRWYDLVNLLFQTTDRCGVDCLRRRACLSTG